MYCGYTEKDNLSLREKCSNMEFFLFCICPYFDWILAGTETVYVTDIAFLQIWPSFAVTIVKFKSCLKFAI